jgi:DNA polymerase-1
LRLYWSPSSNLSSAEIIELWENTLALPPSVVACDTETISLNNKSVVGVGIAINSMQGFYITPDDPDFLRYLTLLQDPRIQVIYHNAPFDLRVLRPHKVQYSNIDDTANLCRLANQPADLETASWFVGLPTEQAKKFMERFKAKTMQDAPPADVGKKCCQDAIATYRLYFYLQKECPEIWSYYRKFDRALIPRLEDINAVGINLHQETLDRLDDFYTGELSFYRTVANNMGFNPGSSQQVGYVLAKRGNYLPLNKSKMHLATDDDTLQKFNDPLIPLILNYRHCQVMKRTFVDKLKMSSRAYTTLAPDAITGRLTSKDMNLQNIPNLSDVGKAVRMRMAFWPDEPETIWTSWDASQIELRVLAHLSDDPTMKGIFASEGGDIHGNTEHALWGTRGPNRLRAKTFNFAMVYGADVQTVADRIHERRISTVSHLMRSWMKAYPVAASWIQTQVEAAQYTGTVESMFGRKMVLPVDRGEKHMNNCAINFPIQCSAGEIWKLVMLELAGLNLIPQTRNQVHDELNFSGAVLPPKDLEDLSPIHVPIEVKQGSNWGMLSDVATPRYQ